MWMRCLNHQMMIRYTHRRVTDLDMHRRGIRVYVDVHVCRSTVVRYLQGRFHLESTGTSAGHCATLAHGGTCSMLERC
ncbi:uncharacterized protein LOC125759563 isoform X2 [Rhipicephalus sanguineus]|uniref:uncharacterized protein LOC125759563 isoform X2 n=1 Tax=Rhipicephalus sanguineus TaxID=34632 RepID=UPI0020C46658|nr:uncharacterized protein LOC125759563 isoform X2 [Rhipicephalus sanguineus]